MAKKKRTRPKGYAPWDPEPNTQVILEQVYRILDDYAEFLPLTVRQIFYILVEVYGFPKTENAYNRLVEYLVRARRSGRIRFEHIRDETFSQLGHRYHFDGEEGFWSHINGVARRYKQDKLANQKYSIRVYCEAVGMLTQLHALLEPYSVPVYSCSGFDSLTAKELLARWCHDTYVYRGKLPLVLHLGDHDPDGESIFEVVREDVLAFLRRDAPQFFRSTTEHGSWSDFIFKRAALTAEQVTLHRLPTAPRRSRVPVPLQEAVRELANSRHSRPTCWLATSCVT